MVQRPFPRSEEEIRPGTAHQEAAPHRRLPEGNQGRGGRRPRQHQESHAPRAPGLRHPRHDAVQAHHRMADRPRLPEGGRLRSRHQFQLLLRRLRLQAPGRGRFMARRSGLAGAELQLFPAEERQRARLLHSHRSLDLQPRDPSQLQHQNPVHRAGILGHHPRQDRQGERQHPHTHHPEHHARTQLPDSL